MVNGVSMENMTSSFAIQILKTGTKVANIVSGVGGRARLGPRWVPLPEDSPERAGVPQGHRCVDRALSCPLPTHLPSQTVKRPRKIQLPATGAGGAGLGHQDSDDEADRGRGYDGDTSSGSGRSWGERSRRPRGGRRSRAGGSEANGLALVSGFKRLPRQDVQMRPVKSVLVRRTDSDGERPAGLGAVGLGVPERGPHCCPVLVWCAAGRIMGPKDVPILVPRPEDMSPQ